MNSKYLACVAIVLLSFAAYGPILWNGAGFSHPDDSAAAQLRCCSFRPLLALTYQANMRFGGWMVINLGLHLAASLLVFYVSGLPLAGMIFAVHPMAADAVASVGGRSAELLAVSVLFGIAVWQKKQIAGWLLGVVAVLSSAGFAYSYLGTLAGAPGRWQYMMQYASTLGGYVFPRMFLPFHLSAEPLIVYRPGAASIAILLLEISAVCLVRLRGTIRLGIGLVVLPLIPYLFIPLPNGFYEHRAYLSLAGIAILLSILFARIPRAAFVVVPMFLIMSVSRTQVYSEPVRLWQDAVDKDQANGRALVNLGTIHATLGRVYEAQGEFETAIAVAPQIKTAWQNLATLYVLRGNISEASRVLDAYDALAASHSTFQN